MSPLDNEPKRGQITALEYQTASEHHMHQMGTRFTIAGFYLAAMGFLIQSLVSDTSDFDTRVITCTLGVILTLPIWMLELRTRYLIRLYARRMVQIERDDLGIDIDDGFTGVMSQIYESPPQTYNSALEEPIHSRPYRAIFARSKKPLSVSWGSYVSHSMGFDLLYGLCIVFWIVVAVYFISGRPTSKQTSVPSESIPHATDIVLPTRIPTYSPTQLSNP